MKVYIVSQYNWNQYFPRAIFDSLEAAQKWRKDYISTGYQHFTERQFPISEHEVNGPIGNFWEKNF